MKTKEFNQLQKAVKAGNLKGLKKDTIEQLTVLQAQKIEDKMIDLELTEEGNQILDILTAYIVAGTKEEKKVANKKAPKAPEAPQKEEKKEEGKKSTGKKTSSLKGNKPQEKASQGLKEGQIVKFRVEDEEIEHNIKIVNIGKHHIIAVMAEDEKEVFNIRKTDFDKLIFSWKDRHNEEYNIIVTL